jgi:hypothetical protein
MLVDQKEIAPSRNLNSYDMDVCVYVAHQIDPFAGLSCVMHHASLIIPSTERL